MHIHFTELCACVCVVEKNKFAEDGISMGDSDPWLQQLKLDIDKMTKEEIVSEMSLKEMAHDASEGNNPEFRNLKGYPENEIYSEFKKRGVKLSEDPDPEMQKAGTAALITCIFKVKYHFCVSCLCVL